MFDMKMVSALCGMFSLSFLFAASAGHGGASIDTERIYLSGHGCDDAVGWEFSLDGGEAAILPVPSCWEAQGFGKLQYVAVPKSDSNIGEHDPVRNRAVQDNFIRVEVSVPSSAKSVKIVATDPGVVIDRVGIRFR